MQQTNWIDRKFPAIDDNGLFPVILERLTGTPARIEEKVRGIEDGMRKVKMAGKWSLQEEIGHLSDLEPLWSGRVDDFVDGLPEMRPADLSNRGTTEAGHNDTDIHELLNRFRRYRQDFADKLKRLDPEHFERTSLHPRLKTKMRIVDLAHFVSEHDDHHLARMSALLSDLQRER